jgi:hypothetical protein
MLDLSPRNRDSILASHCGTTVEVVSIEASGICRPPEGDHGPTLPAIKQMLEKRLEIARTGIHEAQQLLHSGNDEDARIVLEKVDEDLHLLRRRVRREFEMAESLACGV